MTPPPPSTLSKISVLKAWIPEGTSALVVKFKNRADVNLVNRFKKNLDPEAKVFDVVPPCCEDIERYLQKKAYLLREPGPNLLKCKTRVCWAGYRRVLMSKPASNTKSTFRIVCGNEAVGVLAYHPDIAPLFTSDRPLSRCPPTVPLADFPPLLNSPILPGLDLAGHHSEILATQSGSSKRVTGSSTGTAGSKKRKSTTAAAPPSTTPVQSTPSQVYRTPCVTQHPQSSHDATTSTPKMDSTAGPSRRLDYTEGNNDSGVE